MRKLTLSHADLCSRNFSIAFCYFALFSIWRTVLKICRKKCFIRWWCIVSLAFHGLWMTNGYNGIFVITRLFTHACNLFFFVWGPTRVAMGDQQARIRDEGVCLKGPAAVAKLLNCRYQHNTSAGVDRERQLLDRTITRIRRTLTSRVSSETSRWFAAGHVDRLIEFCETCY